MSNYTQQYETTVAEMEAACDKQSALFREGEAEWSRTLRAEQKRRQPRQRVHFQPVPQAEQDAMKAPLLAKYTPQLEAAKAAIEALKLERDRLAPLVPCAGQPFMTLVESANSSMFSTQGYGSFAYTRASLQPLEEKLKRLGFATHVRQVDYKSGVGHDWYGRSFSTQRCNYELWADCTETMADAVRHTVTVADVLAVADSTALNGQVLLMG